MKKLNNNAFTLTEMLTVIVIITLIMLIVLPSFTNLFKSNQKQLDDSYKKLMIEYAMVSDLNNRDRINLNELTELRDKIPDNCDGYVTIDHTKITPSYEAFITCD